MAAYPPGGTFLDTFKTSFVNVPVDKADNNAIDTTEFLNAAESLLALFGILTLPMYFEKYQANIQSDLLGSAAFGPVKNDIAGNIKVYFQTSN